MENKNNEPKKQSTDPKSQKYHSRTAEYKAENKKNEKHGKDAF